MKKPKKIAEFKEAVNLQTFFDKAMTEKEMLEGVRGVVMVIVTKDGGLRIKSHCASSFTPSVLTLIGGLETAKSHIFDRVRGK